jgi:hypothetical protein
VSEPLVIVGNGMAAARLVDEMTRCALARHTIAVIGDEPRGPKPGMVISRRAVSSFCAIFTIVRSSRAIASSRLRNCTTSGASASHTSNGIVSSQASISAASSRACLGPCGAITPTEFCRLGTLGRSLLDARTRGFGKSIKKLDLAQRLGWIIPGPVFKVGAI